MTVESLNANVFQVTADTTDSDYDWTVTPVAGRHYSVNRLSRKENLFEVKLIPEVVVAPLPPGEGASGANDQFVDVWNDVF